MLYLDPKLPAWAVKEANHLYEYRNLQSWDISIKWRSKRSCPQLQCNDGWTNLLIPYKLAEILLRTDVKQEYGKAVLAHEFEHIFLSPLHQVAFQAGQIGRRHRSGKEIDGIINMLFNDAVDSIIDQSLEARGYVRKEGK